MIVTYNVINFIVIINFSDDQSSSFANYFREIFVVSSVLEEPIFLMTNIYIYIYII